MRHALAASLIALAACHSHDAPRATRLADADSARVLVDRNWIDRMPKTARDHLHVYRFTPKMGGGVFQDRTLFKGTFELFRFAVSPREIKFDLPETRERIETGYRIDHVDGPEPFDLRLTIDVDPRGPHVYYGMTSETDTDGHALDARLAAVHVDGE